MPPSNDDQPNSSPPVHFFTNLIATGLFSGYIPWASGTFGTIVGILLYLLPGMEHPLVLSLVSVAAFFAGVVTSAKVAEIVGHKLTRSAELAKATFQHGEHSVADPSIVVIDEIVGIWVTLLFLPKMLIIIVVAFLAFRFLDIIKPPPARQLERIHNGWGIMLDDVVAGIYAMLSLHLYLRFLA